MTKDLLLEKLNTGNPTIEQIKAWATCLPNSTNNKLCSPSYCKPGDVFMHSMLNHPYLLLKRKRRSGWICAMLTSNGEEQPGKVVMDRCNSRMFPDSYITSTFTIISEPVGRYMGNLENRKQVSEIYKKLKDCI